MEYIILDKLMKWLQYELIANKTIYRCLFAF